MGFWAHSDMNKHTHSNWDKRKERQKTLGIKREGRRREKEGEEGDRKERKGRWGGREGREEGKKTEMGREKWSEGDKGQIKEETRQSLFLNGVGRVCK